MRRRTMHLVILVVITTAAMDAQGGSEKSGSALTDAPSKARAVTNPFSNSESARAAGQKLFTRHCSECHGQTAEGTAQAPTLREIPKDVTPGMLQWFIKKGNLRAGMPSWSRLPDQQLWQLVTYLQTLRN
jgi:mono/diheme cytochrome c family protein